MPSCDRLPGLVAPGEHAAGQRVVADHADPLIQDQREQLRFDVAEQEIVARLHAVEARQTQSVTDPQPLGQQPGGIVGAADIAHFAAVHQVIQRPQRLIERRLGVGGVHLVEVDIVGLQAAQAGLDRLEDVLARTAAHRSGHRPSAQRTWSPARSARAAL